MGNITSAIKLVLIEDEPAYSLLLKKILEDINMDHTIVKEASTNKDALAFFQGTTDYDLVFMDIQLEDGYCFEMLNNITIEKPIIFCTSYDTHAIEAFKYNSIDYLLKPVKKEAVAAALKKYKKFQVNQDNSYLERIDKMISEIAPTEYKKRFLVRQASKLKLVNIDDIVCFYSDEGDTKLIEKNGTEYCIEYTMERLESLVDPKHFSRINRKVSINVNYLHSAEDYFNNRLKVKMQKEIPFDLVVSRNRVKDFKAWLKGVS